MTVVAFLSTAPVTEGSMAEDVAAAIEAIDEFDVEYETTPMGTIMEAEEVGEILAATEAAHEAIDADRVSTFLKIDDKRAVDSSAAEKVESVEEHLGRPAKSDR